ncbi:MAG: GntR family transcriptional regulator [Aliidongia sp.]
MSGAETAAVPLYLGIKHMLMAKIATGEWPPRHRVPSENELVARLGVSRMTINRALRELAQDGVLLRVQASVPSSRKAKAIPAFSRSATLPKRSPSAATRTAPQS